MQLKLLNRIATVKDDGTVEFEVPGDVDPLSIGPRDAHPQVVDEEPIDTADPQYIPPLQIVMLIVGTRGDVQPFIAIGKRLQVIRIYLTLIICFYICIVCIDLMCCNSIILAVKHLLSLSFTHSIDLCPMNTTDSMILM